MLKEDSKFGISISIIISIYLYPYPSLLPARYYPHCPYRTAVSVSYPERETGKDKTGFGQLVEIHQVFNQDHARCQDDVVHRKGFRIYRIKTDGIASQAFQAERGHV